METQSIKSPNSLNFPKAIVNKYPVLSVKYGSPYGNQRTEEENLLVLQWDRQLINVYQN